MATATQLNRELVRQEKKLLAQAARPWQRARSQLRGARAQKGKAKLDVNIARHEPPLRVKRRLVLARVQEGGGAHPYRLKWLNQLGQVQSLPLMTRETVRARAAQLRAQQLEYEITAVLSKL